MEKLLNLLNEYKQGKPFQFTGYDEEYGMFDTNLNMEGNTSLPAETITCKKFGFIQWLYDEQKIIDDNKMGEVNIIELEDKASGIITDYSLTSENVIMLLAIQDDPISFLISVLK